MSFCNTDILIQNIQFLMKANNITQEKLADILGMSQPNVSKALSLKDKKCFTLDQVVGIANHFGVSIDFLVGNRSAKSQETGPRAVADFLSKVIENHDAKYTTVEIEETVYELKEHYNVFSGPVYEDASPEKRIVSYPAIYFPDYWQLPDPADVDRDTLGEVEAEARQVGNESRMKPVNDFIRKFIQIFEIYDKKGVDEDAYRTVVDNYLSKLRDR